MQREAFFFRRFAASLLLLCFSFSVEAYTVTFNTKKTHTGTLLNYSVPFTVVDNTCAALNLVLRPSLFACSSDPVVVGTRLILVYSDPNGATDFYSTSVLTTDAPGATIDYPDSAYPPFQQAMTGFINDAAASGGSGGGGSTTVTVASAFGTATPDQYAAMTTIFGLILCAGAIIWGGKRVLKLFGTMGEA